MIMNWNPISTQPPDELVEVQDEFGNTAKAYPTIYPFKFGQNTSNKKLVKRVVPCEPYWDGGWLIECVGLTDPLKGKIKQWRQLTN